MNASAATTLLEFRTELDAPPERVYAALTEAAQMARWLCDQAEGAPSEGGRLTLRWSGDQASSQPFVGRWLVLRSPTSVAFEGGNPEHPDGYAGRIGFEVSPRASGSVLITRHRLPARPEYGAVAAIYAEAWPRALARLSALVAGSA